jgi:hypothetical protein
MTSSLNSTLRYAARCATREQPHSNGMQSDVEGLGSNFRCTFGFNFIQGQRTRRRPSTPLMPGPLGGCS